MRTILKLLGVYSQSIGRDISPPSPLVSAPLLGAVQYQLLCAKVQPLSVPPYFRLVLLTSFTLVTALKLLKFENYLKELNCPPPSPYVRVKFKIGLNVCTLD